MVGLFYLSREMAFYILLMLLSCGERMHHASVACDKVYRGRSLASSRIIPPDYVRERGFIRYILCNPSFVFSNKYE